MKRVALALTFVFLWLLPAVARAESVPIPPAPTRWATDTAGFLSPQALQSVDAQLERYEQATGNQVLVWIGATTGETPLEDWTVKAFEQWKVGRKGLDNGLILFVFANDRKTRIEVGYGLEDEVPDAAASRVLNDHVLPRIRAGDRDGAIQAGVDAVFAAIAGGAASASPSGAPVPVTSEPPRRARPTPLIQKVFVGVLVVGFIVLLIFNPQLALYILFSILSSGGGRSGGGGGGGFSGGGGRSGGGGASGSW